MSAYGKYRVIAADTLDDLKRHRQIIEEKLQKGGLTPALQLELDGALKRALVDETEARDELEVIIADEDKEAASKEDGSGSDEGSQSGGSASGGGKSSGSGGDGGGMSGDDGVVETETADGIDGLTALEVFELLFLLTETDLGITQNANNTAVDAATLVFDRDEGVALINEPYDIGHDHRAHEHGAMLHALEHHAATIVGARTMQLHVHADAVNLLRERGYQLYGDAARRNGFVVQRMRKALGRSLGTPKSGPDA